MSKVNKSRQSASYNDIDQIFKDQMDVIMKGLDSANRCLSSKGQSNQNEFQSAPGKFSDLPSGQVERGNIISHPKLDVRTKRRTSA